MTFSQKTKFHQSINLHNIDFHCWTLQVELCDDKRTTTANNENNSKTQGRSTYIVGSSQVLVRIWLQASIMELCLFCCT